MQRFTLLLINIMVGLMIVLIGLSVTPWSTPRTSNHGLCGITHVFLMDSSTTRLAIIPALVSALGWRRCFFQSPHVWVSEESDIWPENQYSLISESFFSIPCWVLSSSTPSSSLVSHGSMMYQVLGPWPTAKRPHSRPGNRKIGRDADFKLICSAWILQLT